MSRRGRWVINQGGGHLTFRGSHTASSICFLLAATFLAAVQEDTYRKRTSTHISRILKIVGRWGQARYWDKWKAPANRLTWGGGLFRWQLVEAVQEGCGNRGGLLVSL